MKLEEINRDNLLQGLDSEGQDMPFYSNSEYGFNKLMRNPRNRGHWDLKNTGQYHKGIYTIVKKKEILFRQRFRNKKTLWIEIMMEKVNRKPLGITKAQMQKARENNLKRTDVKGRILDIINKGK